MMRETASAPPADPLEAVTHPDPYPYYARLAAEQPFGYHAALDLWVAASAAAVEEVLACPALGVRPPDEPVPANLRDTSTGVVFSRLVRMNDGAYHQETRPAVEAALAAVDGAAASAIARELAGDLLSGPDPGNLAERIERLMFALPVRVVARLCGIGAEEREAVEREVRAYVDAVKPGSPGPADDAAERLLGRLDAARLACPASLAAILAGQLERDAALANALGLLMQSYEATAGLIGNTLVAARREAAAGRAVMVDARFVREVARHDAPVQNTRRFALQDCRVGGRELKRGDGVLVLLAAANRDPAANPEPDSFLPGREGARLYTFGRSAHRCPGEEIAVAVAVEAAAALGRAGIDWAMLPAPSGYLASSNARIPRFSA